MSPLEVGTGTPRLVPRTASAGRVGELCLASKEFYGRVDAATGATTFLVVARNLFLPEDTGASTAYDPSRDRLYSTTGTTLRLHDAGP